MRGTDVIEKTGLFLWVKEKFVPSNYCTHRKDLIFNIHFVWRNQISNVWFSSIEKILELNIRILDFTKIQWKIQISQNR